MFIRLTWRMFISSTNRIFTIIPFRTFEISSTFIVLWNFAFENYSISKLIKHVASIPTIIFSYFIIFGLYSHCISQISTYILRVFWLDKIIFNSIESTVNIESWHLRLCSSDYRVSFKTSHLNAIMLSTTYIIFTFVIQFKWTIR